jgi:hypothetical protein
VQREIFQYYLTGRSQNSPELTKVKEYINTIPEIEFRTMSEFGKHLQNCCSKVGNRRRDLFQSYAFIENEPRTKQAQELDKLLDWIREESSNFGAGGEQCIRFHEKCIYEVY